MENRPIDPYAISLDRARWKADGLFDASASGTPDPVDWTDELVDLHGFDRLPVEVPG